MSVLAQVRVKWSTICFLQSGAMPINQWGKSTSRRWNSDEPGVRELMDEWQPYIVMASDFVSRAAGRKRHGAVWSTERHNFVCAVLMVATALKNGDGPESVAHDCLYITAVKGQRQ